MSNKKKIVFLGSSVTLGGGGWSICELIAEDERYEVTKWAVGGTTLANKKDNSYVARFDTHIDEVTDADLFICQLSTNDAGPSSELGVISVSKRIEAFDTSTVIGAIEYIIARARAKWGCPVMFYTGTYFESDYYPKMVDALLEIAKKWEIGVIDLWNDEEMRKVSPEDYARYMKDHVHPTAEGYREWWGPKFTSAIEAVFEKGDK